MYRTNGTPKQVKRAQANYLRRAYLCEYIVAKRAGHEFVAANHWATHQKWQAIYAAVKAELDGPQPQPQPQKPRAARASQHDNVDILCSWGRYHLTKPLDEPASKTERPAQSDRPTQLELF
jgi:hypothetical protein